MYSPFQRIEMYCPNKRNFINNRILRIWSLLCRLTLNENTVDT